MDIIEQIARAICLAEGVAPECVEDRWREYTDAATAAHSVIAGKVAELTDALESIKHHCEPQPSALAKAIVATCDAALAPYPERRHE